MLVVKSDFRTLPLEQLNMLGRFHARTTTMYELHHMYDIGSRIYTQLIPGLHLLDFDLPAFDLGRQRADTTARAASPSYETEAPVA